MLKRRVRPVVSIVAITAAIAIGACSALTDAGSNGPVGLYQLQTQACTDTAAPRTGWVNCKAQAYLAVTANLQSGYVSVYVPYPDATDFYSGEAAVVSTFGGNVVVNLNNPYISRCVANYATTLTVYDGHIGDQSRKLKSFPVVVGSIC